MSIDPCVALLNLGVFFFFQEIKIIDSKSKYQTQVILLIMFQLSLRGSDFSL